MNVPERRTPRWICGHSRKDRIRNEVIRTRWSGLCGRQDKGSNVEMVRECEKEVCDARVSRYERLAITGSMRGRGKLKKNWGR